MPDSQSASQADTAARRREVQELLHLVRTRPKSRADALPRLQEALRNETDPWIASSAATGIGMILGPDAGREARLGLLRHADPAIVAHAALDATDPGLLPTLLELLERNPDPRVQASILCMIGRHRDERVFPLLIDRLNCPQWRHLAVQSLELLEDPRAIPHLEIFGNDTTVLPERDERGAPLTLGDTARAAVRRLRYVASQPDRVR